MADTLTGVLVDIAIERSRQKNLHGHTAEKDDAQPKARLALAGAAYALNGGRQLQGGKCAQHRASGLSMMMFGILAAMQDGPLSRP